MKVILASSSAIKLAACQAAFKQIGSPDIITTAASSGVNKQSVGIETSWGAIARVQAAQTAHPDASLYVAIESGLFQRDQEYYDHALVLLMTRMGLLISRYSEGLELPTAMVEKAKLKDFAINTVGDTLAEYGQVKNADDPHICLVGKSRADYIEETLAQTLTSLNHGSLS